MCLLLHSFYNKNYVINMKCNSSRDQYYKKFNSATIRTLKLYRNNHNNDAMPKI